MILAEDQGSTRPVARPTEIPIPHSVLRYASAGQLSDDPLADYLDQFIRRAIQDALAQATSAYWMRRAAAFEWARPSSADCDPSTRLGAENIERDRRCAETAAMCRFHADLLSDPELWRDELDEYLAYLNGDTTSHPWAVSTPWANTSERAVA